MQEGEVAFLGMLAQVSISERARRVGVAQPSGEVAAGGAGGRRVAARPERSAQRQRAQREQHVAAV